MAPSLGSEFHRALVDYEEEVLCVEPLEAKFTLVLDDESLTVTVDEELSVIDAVQRPVSEGE